MWTIKYSKQAVKDSKKIEQSNLKQSVENLLEVLKENLELFMIKYNPKAKEGMPG